MLKKFYVREYSRAIGQIIDTGPLLTFAKAKKELRKITREDAKWARRHFGSAVRHIEDTYVEITATKDKNSALWARWGIAEVS